MRNEWAIISVNTEEKKVSEVIQLGHNFIKFSGNFTSINHTAELVISINN